MQDARAGVYIKSGGNGFGLGVGVTGQVRRGNGISPGGFILQGQVVDVAGKRRAGLQDPNLGRNPRLPLSIRAAAWATINCPVLWRKVCRTMLKDRR